MYCLEILAPCNFQVKKKKKKKKRERERERRRKLEGIFFGNDTEVGAIFFYFITTHDNGRLRTSRGKIRGI